MKFDRWLGSVDIPAGLGRDPRRECQQTLGSADFFRCNLEKVMTGARGWRLSETDCATGYGGVGAGAFSSKRIVAGLQRAAIKMLLGLIYARRNFWGSSDMKLICIGLCLASLGLLTGCETIEKAASDAGIKVTKTPIPAGGSETTGGREANVSGATSTAGNGAPNPIRGTELDGIFKKFPISNSNRPETYPRVALTLKSATPGVFNLRGPSTLAPNDCVVFDIRLWPSSKSSKKFENLKMCTDAVAKEAQGVAFRTLNLF